MAKIISVEPKEKYFQVKVQMDVCTPLNPTGIITAKVWNSDTELVAKLKPNSIIDGIFETTKYGEVIKQITVIKEGRLGLTAEEQRENFDIIIGWCREPKIKELLTQHELEFMTAPAASKHHHAYVGGLIQHTAEVLKSCEDEDNAKCDYRTLLYAAILHDFGKIFEYKIDTETGIITYNEDFRKELGLEGSKIAPHIMWAYNFCIERGFVQLAQIVAGHHGPQEWGSLLIPQTREAHLLFMADYKSSKLGKITVDLLEDDFCDDGPSPELIISKMIEHSGEDESPLDDCFAGDLLYKQPMNFLPRRQ